MCQLGESSRIRGLGQHRYDYYRPSADLRCPKCQKKREPKEFPFLRNHRGQCGSFEEATPRIRKLRPEVLRAIDSADPLICSYCLPSHGPARAYMQIRQEKRAASAVAAWMKA